MAASARPATATGPGDPLAMSLDAVMVHVTLDGRGHGWGLARFDLAPATRDVTLRMPPGMRVFDILVDGREARATPGADAAWSVSLHDIRWPRTMLVVFAGDLAGRADRGDVLLLEPPRIEGAASSDVLWSIDSPAGMPLRLVGETRPLDVVAWGARREEARRRMAAAFDRALENVAGPESGRLAAFARRREEGEPPALESAWDQAFAVAAADRRLFALGAGDRGITLRAERMPDPTAVPRGGATLAVLAAWAVAWGLRARRTVDMRGMVRDLWPWVILAGGLAWIVWLRPAVPGWTLLAVGGLAAVARLLPQRRGRSTEPRPADASTQAIAPG